MIKKIQVFLILILTISCLCTAKEEGSTISQQMTNAQEEISEMKTLGIPTSRVDELMEECKQLYLAQNALKSSGEEPDYSRIIQNLQEIDEIKKSAIEAQDELKIFNESYDESSMRFDLSEMSAEYNRILQSFEEERFEDTITLIEGGYNTLSDIESSQTTLNLFYQSATQSITDFFKSQWKLLLISLASLLVLLLGFSTAIKKFRTKRKLKGLELQKKTIMGLLRNLQERYFRKKDLSELEYDIKKTKFEEMIRDINRQLPLLNTKMLRLSKKRKRKSR